MSETVKFVVDVFEGDVFDTRENKSGAAYILDQAGLDNLFSTVVALQGLLEAIGKVSLKANSEIAEDIMLQIIEGRQALAAFGGPSFQKLSTREEYHEPASD